MKKALFGPVLLIATLLAFRADAKDADLLRGWVSASPQCIPTTEFRSATRSVELSPEQFEFVRALYVALPPMSKTLPPGDRALMVSVGDETMLALVSDNLACARFLAPGFLVEMLMQVGEGGTGVVGQPTSETDAR